MTDPSGGMKVHLQPPNRKASTASTPIVKVPVSNEESQFHRLLHLYIHDYCLKKNLLKTANAIVSETGIRTDEGVPVGREGEKSLLNEWFAMFWKTLHESLQSQSSSRDIFSLNCNRKEKKSCEEKQDHLIAASLAAELAAHQQNEVPVHADSQSQKPKVSMRKSSFGHRKEQSQTLNTIYTTFSVKRKKYDHLKALSKTQKEEEAIFTPTPMMYLTQADREHCSQHFGVVSSRLLSTDQFLNQDETFSTSLAPSNVWNSYYGKGDLASPAYHEEPTFSCAKKRYVPS